MFQFGNFPFEKEFEADGYTKLLCHFNYLEGWPSWNLEAKDRSFTGIKEAVNGAVSANPAIEGFLNGCAYFPAGNVADYISYNNDPALSITSKLTLECFICPTRIVGATQTIVTRPLGVTGAHTYGLYFVDGDPNVTLSFVIRITGALKTVSATIARTSFYGLWLHIKGTYDGRYQRLYVNGVEQASQAVTGFIDTTSTSLCVGKNSFNNSEPYKGFIDELRISNIDRPFTGRKTYSAKTTLAGMKVQGFGGGQSALENKLTFIREGQSRIRKLTHRILGGKALLVYFCSQNTPGRSIIRKTTRKKCGGHSKLAYYVFEANLTFVVMGSFKVIRSSWEELVNKGHFLYGRDYRAQNFAQSIQQEDPASQSRYGVREKTVELNFVRDSAMAAELTDYYFNASKEIKAQIRFRTFLGGLHLEVGDHILVNYPLYDLSGELFTVTDIRFLAGSGQKHQMDRVEIEAQEG